METWAIPIAVAGSFQSEKPDPMRCAFDCGLFEMSTGYHTFRGIIDAPGLELQDHQAAELVAAAAALMKMCQARDLLVPALNPNIKVLVATDFVLRNLEQLRSSGQPGTQGPNMHKLFIMVEELCLKAQASLPNPTEFVETQPQADLGLHRAMTAAGGIEEDYEMRVIVSGDTIRIKEEEKLGGNVLVFRQGGDVVCHEAGVAADE